VEIDLTQQLKKKMSLNMSALSYEK